MLLLLLLLQNHRAILEAELESVGLRLNKEPPNIYFKKTKTGGIKFGSMCPVTKLGADPNKVRAQPVGAADSCTSPASRAAAAAAGDAGAHTVPAQRVIIVHELLSSCC